MNRTMATWLSLITVLVITALGIAVVGLVLAAKATDEKADEAEVTRQLDELRGNVDGEIDALQSAIDEVGASVGELATDEEAQIGAIDAAFNALQQRTSDIEELLGIDEQ